MTYAPIILFVYNRPWHTKQTMAALKKNVLAEHSDLFIFSDGPKNELDADLVGNVRRYIETIDGFARITLIKREKNLGLANSVISGVTEIVNTYGSVIVLEDDLVISPYFLQFMNTALTMYADNEVVGSINGFMYPIKKQMPHNFFLRYADCWGWATWKRAWDLFQPDALALHEELKRKKLEYLFDFDGTFPFTDMLEQQINGSINSWAIRWQASLFLLDKLNFFPHKSLVQNIGNDGSGTHGGKQNLVPSKKASVFGVIASQSPISVVVVPVKIDIKAYKAFIVFFKSLSKKSSLERISLLIPSQIKKIFKAIKGIA